MKIVSATVLATIVCQLIDNSLSTLCASCVCLRFCASCQTPRRHGPARKSGAMWFLSNCQTLRRFGILHKPLAPACINPATVAAAFRDSHGGKRKNRAFRCWTRPGICISSGMIRALPRMKGGRFSSRDRKMELRKALCSTTPPLIHHPFTAPSPLLRPRPSTLHLPLAQSSSIILVIQQRACF